MRQEAEATKIAEQAISSMEDDRQSARDACRRLLHCVAEFPFNDDTDRAAWLAGVLSLVNRQLIDGPVPLFVIDATVPGSGKGLLAGAAASIAGYPMAYLKQAPTEAEWIAQISMVAEENEEMAIIDCHQPLAADALAAVLSSRDWAVSKPRSSAATTAPLGTVWWAAGTNVQLGMEIARRSLVIRLGAFDRHSERVYAQRKTALPGALNELAPMEDARSVLAIYFKWKESEPEEVAGVAGYSAWSSTIRAAMMWAGMVDPLGASPLSRGEGDPRTIAGAP